MLDPCNAAVLLEFLRLRVDDSFNIPQPQVGYNLIQLLEVTPL